VLLGGNSPDTAPSPANIRLRVPPLSEWNTLSVSARMPRASSAAITLPICSSMAVIMAA
jgi:hypothetical protein